MDINDVNSWENLLYYMFESMDNVDLSLKSCVEGYSIKAEHFNMVIGLCMSNRKNTSVNDEFFNILKKVREDFERK